MRIAFIVDSFPAISETFILNQIIGMIDLGHEVRILAGSRPDDRESHEDIKKYNLMSMTYYHNDQFHDKLTRVLLFLFLFFFFCHKNPKAFFNSIRIFKYGRDALSLAYFYKVFLFSLFGGFDIMQCHFGPNGNLAATLKEMGIKGKIVTMFHGYDIRRGIRDGGGIYKKVFEQGDVVLSISNYNYKHLIEFGADPKKVIYHPVGIDLKKYTFRKKDGQAKESQSIKILSVSRLIEEKGLSFGLRAMAKLIHERKIANIEYQIIGDGPLRADIEKLSNDLKIRANVHFWGIQKHENVVELLNRSDLFFLPSIAEALPVVLMEAQASGLPVVATNVGSVAQIVEDGQTGFVVPSRDVDAMADKLEFLIRHSEQWPDMGRRGRKIIEEKFDSNVLNKKLEEIYLSLIEQKHE